MAKSDMEDRLAIRTLIESWVVFRDSLMWDRFRTVWHDDGQMWSTWFQGPAEDFLKVSIKGYEAGVRVTHTLGGMVIDLEGKRAVAQTKMSILQRGAIEGIACDVTCHGRFYDLIEKRKGRWGIVLRRCIYERDRIDTVDPAAKLRLDRTLLESFPVGYRHLAYLQVQGGFEVKPDLPGLDGPSVEALYEKGKDWLQGKML